MTCRCRDTATFAHSSPTASNVSCSPFSRNKGLLQNVLELTFNPIATARMLFLAPTPFRCAHPRETLVFRQKSDRFICCQAKKRGSGRRSDEAMRHRRLATKVCAHEGRVFSWTVFGRFSNETAFCVLHEAAVCATYRRNLLLYLRSCPTQRTRKSLI